MKNIESFIFDTLKLQCADINYELSDEFPQELRNFFKGIPPKLILNFDTFGYEATITGTKMPIWIKPLHFEQNLNNAIDALESVEQLLKENIENAMMLLGINYYDQYFNVHEGHNNVNLNTFNNIKGEIDIEGKKENLIIRLGHKIFELIEYTKAAKWAGKVLFNIDSTEIEVSNNYSYVNRVRESLRILIEKQREINRYDQEIIIPISLKNAKKPDNTFLIGRWVADGESDNINGKRDPNSPLGHLSLDLDLFHSQYDFLYEDAKYLRTRRIGMQVIDSNSLVQPPSSNPTNIWQIGLWDMYGAVNSENEDIPRNPSLVFKVAADKSPNSISWKSDDTLFNCRPKSRYIISIGRESHILNRYLEIRDIVIYFHVVYNTMWKNG